MGATRRNGLAARRRTDDEGEEDGNFAATAEDDSLSEPSIPSDVDDDADADGEASESSGRGTPNKSGRQNGKKRGGKNGRQAHLTKPAQVASALGDEETVTNGLNTPVQDEAAEEIHFDDLGGESINAVALVGLPVVAETPESPARAESLIERKKREHEEYKQKRDADPAFVPNRGGFFMHDQRSHYSTQNGFRLAFRGRGRGRGGLGQQGPEHQ